jgi:hypothetical protein
MADTSLGFRPRYRLSGLAFTKQTLTIKDTETLTKGDLVNLESGEIDLGATNDAAFVGVVMETKAGTDSTTTYLCITDRDAVYGVYDANARAIGATLDIAGATGAMTVAATSNADLVVVANSTAAEETLVMISPGNHWQD